MSFSKTVVRSGVLALVLAGGAALGGCTFTPVYSEANLARSDLQLTFSKPNNRSEQIINQDLGLRFSPAPGAQTQLAAVSAYSYARGIALSRTANPEKPAEITVVATVTLSPKPGSDAQPITITRRATASYTTSDQILATNSAEIETTEQAAHAVAKALRLALLAATAR